MGNGKSIMPGSRASHTIWLVHKFRYRFVCIWNLQCSTALYSSSLWRSTQRGIVLCVSRNSPGLFCVLVEWHYSAQCIHWRYQMPDATQVHAIREISLCLFSNSSFNATYASLHRIECEHGNGDEPTTNKLDVQLLDLVLNLQEWKICWVARIRPPATSILERIGFGNWLWRALPMYR